MLSLYIYMPSKEGMSFTRILLVWFYLFDFCGDCFSGIYFIEAVSLILYFCGISSIVVSIKENLRNLKQLSYQMYCKDQWMSFTVSLILFLKKLLGNRQTTQLILHMENKLTSNEKAMDVAMEMKCHCYSFIKLFYAKRCFSSRVRK